MKKRVLSLLISGVLVVSLNPSLAFAWQQQELVAGSAAVAEAQSQGSGQLTSQASKKAVLAKKTKSMRAKYKAVLRNANLGKGAFNKVYKKAANATAWRVYDYCMYDIGKNGIPELFVNAGTCAADTFWYVFTMKSGKAKFVGKFGDGYSYLCSGKGGAVYAPSYHMGVGRIYMGKISGGKLVSKRAVVDTAELKGFPKIQRYSKSHKLKTLQRNNLGQGNDYALINKAKITK